jgi:DNA mismatch endonuclease (patch repair protein)
MADVLTAEQRKLNMSRVRGRDTKPEIQVRHGLHARGLRYRLQDRKLPGRPDLVFSRRQAVVFVHGCFWHGHDCPMFRLPKTRREFWNNKIAANRERDATAHETLLASGWRVLTVWECSLKGTGKWPFELVLDSAVDFLCGNETQRTIAGLLSPTRPAENLGHAIRNRHQIT